MGKGRFLGIAAAAALSVSGLSATAETVIRVSSWAPPTHGINAIVWPTWGKWVEEATEGRVKVKVEYGLAPPPAQLDVVRDGIADATWIFHGYNPGRYVLTQIVELPGLGTSAEAASVAYWRVHQKYLHKAGEHRGITLLALTTHGQGAIHTKKKIGGLADLKGLKIRIGGGVSGAVGEALGVVGVRVPAPKVYETVASGVADGVFMPMETKKSFRLMEVAPNTVIMPGGLYYGSFALVMNTDRLNGLSAADREAVMRVSGEKLSRMVGAMWDEIDKVGTAAAKAAGNDIVVAGDGMAAEYKKLVAHIEKDWIAAASKKGVDATAALAELRAIAGAM